jgi:hypothetical protein
MQRQIGIISDGETDYRVFKKIIETLLSTQVNVIDLRRQTLHDAVDKYWKDINKNSEYLQKAVKGILNTAKVDFLSEIESDYLTCHDIILLTTDAEKCCASLNNESIYWECNSRYFAILNCLIAAVRDFCAIQYAQGVSPAHLPMIIPIVTFPAIEPFLLIAKNEKLSNINGKKPAELKRLLYKTDNPTGQDIEQAIERIQKNQIYEILKIIPESRFLIQTLLLLSKL